MISALCWVPKGASKFIPEVAEPPSNEEIESMIKLEASELRAAGDDEGDNDGDVEMEAGIPEKTKEVTQALDAAQALGKSDKIRNITDALCELDMDHYDEEEDGIELFGSGTGDAFYPSNELDPYLLNKDDDDEEETEDMTIKPTDGVIICAHNEDDVSQLEILVFEESSDGDSNMYVHHEILLPAFPLCLAWLDCNLKSGDKGNFIAVGSMEAAIEIWDLDILDEAEPFRVLGGTEKKKKKGKKKLIKYKDDSHTDSVLGLAWNKQVRNVLASASADKSVKVWDVVTGQCALTVEHHTDKVQAVAWNQHSPEILLSGSFDHSVIMMDVRSNADVVRKWSVKADVESLAWDPHSENSFAVSLENGTVQVFDIRAAASDSLFTLHAHDKAVCSVSYNPSRANLLATGSMDKMVKLWDLSNNQPFCITSRNPRAGAIFSVAFSNDSPFLLAIGGSKGKLQVWDTLTDDGVARKFGASHGKPSTGA